MVKSKTVAKDPVTRETTGKGENTKKSGWFEVSHVLAERGDKVKVSWVGTDSNGQPFAPSWVLKKDCNKATLEKWGKKQRKHLSKRPVPQEKPSKSGHNNTQNSEIQPKRQRKDRRLSLASKDELSPLIGVEIPRPFPQHSQREENDQVPPEITRNQESTIQTQDTNIVLESTSRSQSQCNSSQHIGQTSQSHSPNRESPNYSTFCTDIGLEENTDTQIGSKHCPSSLKASINGDSPLAKSAPKQSTFSFARKIFSWLRTSIDTNISQKESNILSSEMSSKKSWKERSAEIRERFYSQQLPIAESDQPDWFKPEKPPPTVECDHSLVTESLSDHSGPLNVETPDIEGMTIPLDSPACLGPNEYAIPIGVEQVQKDIYSRILQLQAKQITQFCSDPDDADDNLTEQMNKLIRDLCRVSSHHLILENIPNFDKDMTEEKLAMFLARSSSKFQYLGNLLDKLRNLRMTIGVFVEEGKLMFLVEEFLRGKLIRVKRLDQVSPKPYQTHDDISTIRVNLIPTGKDGERAVVVHCDFFIAFDGTIDVSAGHVVSFRKHHLKLNRIQPLLRLVVVNSAEHIVLCCGHRMQTLSELGSVIASSAILRNSIGQLEPFELAYFTLPKVLDWLKSDPNHHPWPLEPLKDFKDKSLSHPGSLDSTVDTEVKQQLLVGSALKRPLEDQLQPGLPLSKRQHIASQQPISSPSSRKQSPEQFYTQNPNFTDRTPSPSLRWTDRVKRLREMHGISSATVVSSIDTNHVTNQPESPIKYPTQPPTHSIDELLIQIRERDEEVFRLSNAVERLRLRNIELLQTNKNLERENDKVSKRIDSLVLENTNLLSKNTHLESEMAAMKSHSGHEIATSDNMGHQQQLEKKARLQAEEIDFLRMRYQEASTIAADLTFRLSEYQSQPKIQSDIQLRRMIKRQIETEYMELQSRINALTRENSMLKDQVLRFAKRSSMEFSC